MDYEKKYNNALERAKQTIEDCGDNQGRKKIIYAIFPELAESEDERIRKWLIELVENQPPKVFIEANKIEVFAFLEKLKEQKPLPGFDELTPDEKMNHPLYLEGFAVGRKVGQVEAEQKPAEWSENDDGCYKLILKELEHNKESQPDYSIHFSRLIEWFITRFKSLRPQPHWKPSEEQIKALRYVAYHLMPDENYRNEMFSLYNELKKL